MFSELPGSRKPRKGGTHLRAGTVVYDAMTGHCQLGSSNSVKLTHTGHGRMGERAPLVRATMDASCLLYLQLETQRSLAVGQLLTAHARSGGGQECLTECDGQYLSA